MKQYFIFYVMYSDIVCFVLFCSVSLKSCWLDLMNGLRTQLENRWIDRFVLNVIKDFPGSSAGEESTCQRRRRKKCGFDPCVRKIPWRREGQQSSMLAWRIPLTEEPGGLQSWTWLEHGRTHYGTIGTLQVLTIGFSLTLALQFH